MLPFELTASSNPRHWMLVLHGFLGLPRNMRSLAKGVIDCCPSWGILQPFLPFHGEAHGINLPPSLDSATDQLRELVVDQSSQGRQISVAVGHSLGGRLLLNLLYQKVDSPLNKLIILDATPSAQEQVINSRSSVALKTIDDLGAINFEVFPTRKAFVEKLAQLGWDAATGNWLAMHLRRVEGGYQLGLNLQGLVSLIEDNYRRDLWSGVERLTERDLGLHVELVIASRGDVFSESDQRKLEALQTESHGQLSIHRVNTGHWVHIEARQWVVDLVCAHLKSS
jgi:pimeloyl-ACP methyl ester carboxylesterase